MYGSGSDELGYEIAELFAGLGIAVIVMFLITIGLAIVVLVGRIKFVKASNQSRRWWWCFFQVMSEVVTFDAMQEVAPLTESDEIFYKYGYIVASYIVLIPCIGPYIVFLAYLGIYIYRIVIHFKVINAVQGRTATKVIACIPCVYFLFWYFLQHDINEYMNSGINDYGYDGMGTQQYNYNQQTAQHQQMQQQMYNQQQYNQQYTQQQYNQQYGQQQYRQPEYSQPRIKGDTGYVVSDNMNNNVDDNQHYDNY